MEATARVLVEEGYDRASTNRIASVAGVSIGSLYQYFPSKEALVAAAAERHTRQVTLVGIGALLDVAERPVEAAARAFVAAAIDAHRVDPDLHRALAEQVPRVGRLADIDAVERRGGPLLRGYLEAHRDEIDIADLDLAVFVLTTVVEALTHTAVLRRPDLIADDTKAATFVDDVAGLVLRYLQPLKSA